MAIGPDNQVTTTGLMGATPKLPAPPDMSGLNQAQSQEGQAPAPMAERPAPERTQDPNIDERIQNLNETEIAQLDGLLGPANAAILKKIAPEASGIIDQFTSQEDVVSLPISAIKNYAMMKYPSSTEQESVQGFVTELSESQSDDTNVPPENMQASNPNPNSMMAPEPNVNQDSDLDTSSIDEDAIDIA